MSGPYEMDDTVGGFYIFNGGESNGGESNGGESNGGESDGTTCNIVALVVFRMIYDEKYFFHCRMKNNKISPEDSTFLEKFILGQVDKEDPRIKNNIYENNYVNKFIRYFKSSNDKNENKNEQRYKNEQQEENDGMENSNRI